MTGESEDGDGDGKGGGFIVIELCATGMCVYVCTTCIHIYPTISIGRDIRWLWTFSCSMFFSFSPTMLYLALGVGIIDALDGAD